MNLFNPVKVAVNNTFTVIILPAILSISSIVATAAEAPVIFNFNESVQPGETISLQGHAFGTIPEVWLQIINGTAQKLRPQLKLNIITAAANYLAAAIPIHIKPGLYAVWVTNGREWSNPKFINRARVVTSEFDEVMPGTVFRIFGRNLGFKDSKSLAFFVQPEKGLRIPAKVLHTDIYEMKIETPDQLDTGTYQLLVSNGDGGHYGEELFDEQLKVKKYAADPFQTGVPWGSDFNFDKNIYNVRTDRRLQRKAAGNGIDNDREAIQEAIDSAAKNGGVVYLPEGTYKIFYTHGCGITMRSRVILKGDGQKKTSIRYGYGSPFSTERVKAPYGWTLGWPDSRSEGMAVIWPGGITTSGMQDLSMQNVNESGDFVHTLKNMPDGGTKIFFQRCTFDLNAGWGLAMVNVNHLLFTDCIFKSTSIDVRGINAPTRTWPWDFKNSSNLLFKNNQHFYYAGRFGANGCHHAIFENNTFIRDGDHQSKGETGGLSLDYTMDIVVQGNRFDVVGNPIKNANQGETILSQGGNAHQQNLGVITFANSSVIVDSKKEWQDFTDRISTDWQYAIHPVNYSIAIVDGKGSGQWRSIIWNNDTTLTVAQPWEVIPSAGSKYVITQWSAQQMLVRNNLLKGNNRGIWFYSGGTDLCIASNQLLNSEGIYIRADQRLPVNRYNLGWNIVIRDNIVMDTDGKRPAYIVSWLAFSKSEPVYGTGILGMEIRKNKITAFQPNVKSGALIKSEGYYNANNKGLPGAGNYKPSGILGTILEGNIATNTDQAYYIGTATSQTVIDQKPQPVNH